MLYGHDDTLFFVEGILDLLQDFDPALPYIITGGNIPWAATRHAYISDTVHQTFNMLVCQSPACNM